MKVCSLQVDLGWAAGILVVCFCLDLQAANWSYIQNAEIKLGVDLSRGSCIGYFSEISPVNNVLNNYDTGRFVQQSYYGDADGSTWAGNPWVYNPVQGGGYLSYWPATTLEFSNTGDAIYARVRPRHWATGEELYNVEMEEWITLEGNVAHIRFKMTYNDDTMTTFRDQEMPACFTDYDFNQLVYYNGTSPWTGDILTYNTVAGSNPPANQRENNLSENWAAYVNSSSQWGVGLYSPGSSAMTFYRYSGGYGESQTSYFAPLRQFRLINGGVVDYDIYLTIGTVSEIRSTFAGIHANLPFDASPVVFEDNFNAAANVWNNMNTELVARQTGGAASSTYTLGLSSGQTLIGPGAGSAGYEFLDPVLVRVNTSGGLGGTASLDLNTDFGPYLTNSTWSLSYKGLLLASVGFSGWTGFSVGHPAQTPDGSTTGFGINLFATGEFEVWNNGTKIHTGNIGSVTSAKYELKAVFDEVANTVNLLFSYVDAPGYTVDMGTCATTFVDGIRYVELRNHVNTSEANGIVDWRVDDLGITLDVTYDTWAKNHGLVGVDALLMTDIEPDGMNNLLEYAFGGNPTNDDAANVTPLFEIVDAGGGSNPINYVYRRRLDADSLGLEYRLNLSTNLLSAWIPVGNAYETGTAGIDLYFESVTNTVPATNSAGFVTLKIQGEF